jgi:alpha/beta superfamily hydrolase
MEDVFVRIESVLILREAQKRGFAVAALNSYGHLNSNNYQWDESPIQQNKDVENTVEMIRKLQSSSELGVVSTDLPVIVFGFSNGGSMASRVAQVPEIDTAVAAIYISNAQEFHEVDAVHPPMVLIPGEQDPGLALQTNTELVQQINNPQQALLLPNPPEPITNGLFTRIPEIDCESSIQIKRALLEGDFIDEATYMLIKDPKEDLTWMTLLSEEVSPYKEAIKDVLVEAYAGHSPSSDQNDSVFDFIEQHL